MFDSVSTRMVEQYYVSLFEGLDRHIGDKLGTLREHAAKVAKGSGRTHPCRARDEDGTGAEWRSYLFAWERPDRPSGLQSQVRSPDGVRTRVSTLRGFRGGAAHGLEEQGDLR
jgi:hypothetical protein